MLGNAIIAFTGTIRKSWIRLTERMSSYIIKEALYIQFVPKDTIINRDEGIELIKAVHGTIVEVLMVQLHQQE